ncbi:DUF993 family protein, partial [Mesorhizobium sp. M2D.F.Ca.ET.145.01.1.1]
MIIQLPDNTGRLHDYRLLGKKIPAALLPSDGPRTVLSAAHVVADPFSASDPSGPAAIAWKATMAFRRHLDG